MKATPGSVVAAMLLIAGCSSKPQSATRRVEQTNRNTRHWVGTTEVLKDYRPPDSSAGKQRSAGFGFSKKQTGEEERQRK
jgi:hypothetical protein